MSLLYHRSFQEALVGKYARVARRVPPKSTVLEIGCNTGYFSHVLMEFGHQVLGVEKDSGAASIARAEGVPVIYGDIEDPAVLTSIGKQFDVVLLMDVLEHLREPVDVLMRLNSVLNEHGRILITGPNVAYWSARIALLFGRWNYQDTGLCDRTHLRFYTASGWRDLVENAGYKVIALEPAEGMIPLEHILLKVPIVGLITSLLRDMALRLLPKLFTIVYLIEAVPTETLLDK